MKRIFDQEKAYEYWKKLMDSKRLKMTRGAQFISRMISWARGDNWRGRKEKKK